MTFLYNKCTALSNEIHFESGYNGVVTMMKAINFTNFERMKEMSKKTRVGIIGTGNISIYWAHYPEYKQVDECEISAICDIDTEKLKKVGDELGIPENRRFTDYNDLIACEDVDVVDIATWNSVHCEIAEAAARAGKSFSIEKPVGMNYAEAKHLEKVAKECGVESFVCLSWRYRPYTRYLRYLIENGKAGKLYHINVRCIKDSGLWEGRKREWRFDNERAGSGVLGDLGSHMFDIVHFCGEKFKEVYAKWGIFIKERPSEETGEILPVDTDDWCNITAELESDTSCTIQLSRCATTIPDLVEFEVFGSKGKLRYVHLAGQHTLEFTDAKTKEVESLTPPAEFNALQSQSFINLMNGIEDEYTAKIHHGLECQAVIDAAFLSATQNRPVKISEITG